MELDTVEAMATLVASQASETEPAAPASALCSGHLAVEMDLVMGLSAILSVVEVQTL